jgi:Protein of unknown function (DUF1592)/Protein of unknown function (DUF1588)/Protein of unknown function (DUF1587)/Protein of unknown function (DUF1585)/Protein of unknown function (DUF1595)/Planctomycete cytochrome C
MGQGIVPEMGRDAGMMGKRIGWSAALVCVLGLSSVGRGADDSASFATLGEEYQRMARPLLKQFCFECHATDDPDGELDLERFATLEDVRLAPKTWVRASEMLEAGEMPPKDADKPSAAERARLKGWIDRYLKAEARARAGDPGPVVLRRLSNAQYTYTLQDLTRLDIHPAREFPVDGAAGEGFTNTGNALVMSPSLLAKYLNAGKAVADHAMLLPNGIAFSTGTSRRDWTDEYLARIRGFYARFADSSGAQQVNLQGIVFGTNEGGRLPVEKYLAATIHHRNELTSGIKTTADVAREERLNAKYMGMLWSVLSAKDHAPILEAFRNRWRSAKVEDAAVLAKEIAGWQQSLWRFNTIGQIGKVGGPKRWEEPVSPLVSRQELRMKMPAATGDEVVIYLAASDAGDGNDGDLVVWERPRLIAPGRPELALRDVRRVADELASMRASAFSKAAACLDAASEAKSAEKPVALKTLAERHGVEPSLLAAWLDYLGIATSGSEIKIDSLLQNKVTRASGYDFANGWSTGELPNVIANSSDQHVRIPGNLKPHGIVMHPSPTLRVAAGWRSPVAGALRITGNVRHAHPECGNGVTWLLEHRRGAARERLASGIAQGPNDVKVGPIADLAVQPGDLVSLLVGPRDGNHSCDLTAVDLTLTSAVGSWDLAKDVSPDILAGNPHADAQGRKDVWLFYTEPDQPGASDTVIPPGSILARWRAATTAVERARLAKGIQDLLTAPAPPPKDSPDGLLYRQLASLRGPLVKAARGTIDTVATQSNVGLDPSLFGKHPDGGTIDAESLCVRAPSIVEVRLPADLVEGCEVVTGGRLDDRASGSAQLRVLASRPGSAQWTAADLPILVRDGSDTRKRFEASFDVLRSVFPPALCYSKIVPVDEVITLSLFYREDDHLSRLMLDDAQANELDKLWEGLRFVSQDALTLVDAFAQLLEYASQDADPKVFEPLRKPINDRAAAFRKALIEAEPKHLESLLAFTSRAYRRPLSDVEGLELLALYRRLRDEEIPHDEALRLTLARVLVAPAFLYRIEKAGQGESAVAVSDWELASRLSYFLWSSTPDAELSRVAANGTLHEPKVLSAQTRRMLRDPKIRRLAIEFTCQWLHIYDFDTLDEKSERHFPTFAALRGDMYEESIQFFTNLFQHDGSVVALFDCDYAYLNAAMASHYGIPGVTGSEWRRVEGVRKYGRGGILGLSTTLAKQSGASRTSPILRGNWVSEVLLGERLPRPPKDVPKLPEDEAAIEGLTVRQVAEQHSHDPKCAGCHVRIDPMGYALEGFDAIGRSRARDLGGRPIDAKAATRDGATFEGIDGLRDYLLTNRRDAVLRQFRRKLLGFALGRSVQLSDEPLLDEMKSRMEAGDFKFSTAVEMIVNSPQFRNVRGRNIKSADAL